VVGRSLVVSCAIELRLRDSATVTTTDFVVHDDDVIHDPSSCYNSQDLPVWIPNASLYKSHTKLHRIEMR
jgi:hypothetical protein